jgi:hypothetical protein
LQSHEYFEELAAIAALGELDPAQVRELKLHLTGCSQCREINDEYNALHIARPALGADMLALIKSRRESVKTGFLEKIALEPPPGGDPAGHEAQLLVAASPWRPLHRASGGLGVALTLSFVFWLGSNYGRRTLIASGQVGTASSTPAIQDTETATMAQKRAEALTQTEVGRNSQLTDKLREEKQRNARLDAALTAKGQELIELEHSRLALQNKLDAETEESRRQQSLVAAKAEQLTQMEATKANDLNMLVALRYQVQDLAEKLKEQKQSLDRERQLLASGRDIRDIIGARNLHIIDVYDTDPEGNTKKSFARAFYTEGKSLIFYAYDLPARRTEEGKYAYTAWGQSDGNKKKVQNLGILLNDDTGQKRWVLNFSDPKVLAEIDSVFITLERVGVDRTEPNGRRILTAYLASQVNHP